VFTALTVKDEYKEVFKKIAEFFQALSVLNEELNDRRALMRLIQTWLRLEPIRSTDMPEPTRVMVTGLLDSRALDCQEIYFLDFNDGVFPATESKASIIPYTLRRAFGLPVMEHTLAEQLYLFFRLIQRPQIIHLYYNAQPDENHGGEPSLVLRLMEATLLHEWVSDYRPPHMPAPIIPDAEDIVVEKTPFIYAKLRQLLFEDSGLSATALNTYLACPLKFYFRYVADLKEPRNFSTWDPANFGTLFHIVMEKMYAPIVGQQDVWLQAEDLDHVKEKLPDVVKTSIAMVETGLPDKNFQLKGKSNLLERMLIKAAKTLVETDKKRAPFRILGTEKALQATLPTEQGNVKFRGKVDRIDETPECLVILDYKTGVSSWKQFDPSFLGDIFDEKKRSDYDVQLALYAWLLDKEVHGPRQISAQIYEVRSLLASNQDESITTAGPEHLYKHLPEFEEQLKRVVNAMLSPQVQFYQTSHLKTCSHCAYKNICRR
jgi:ATP-dependent helicase/DNAse subunit B